MTLLTAQAPKTSIKYLHHSNRLCVRCSVTHKLATGTQTRTERAEWVCFTVGEAGVCAVTRVWGSFILFFQQKYLKAKTTCFARRKSAPQGVTPDTALLITAILILNAAEDEPVAAKRPFPN